MAKNIQIIELPPKGEKFKSIVEQYPDPAKCKKASDAFIKNFEIIQEYFQRASMDDNIDLEETFRKFNKIAKCAIQGYCKINWEEFNNNIIKNSEVKKKAVAFKNLVDGRYDAVMKRATQLYKPDGELAE